MNHNMKLWAECLRSGKYLKTTGYLRRENKFCAEGIACEVMEKQGYGHWAMAEDMFKGPCGYFYEASVPRYDLKNIFGVDSLSVHKDDLTKEIREVVDDLPMNFISFISVASLNDSGADWNIIADYLEVVAKENEFPSVSPR